MQYKLLKEKPIFGLSLFTVADEKNTLQLDFKHDP